MMAYNAGAIVTQLKSNLRDFKTGIKTAKGELDNFGDAAKRNAGKIKRGGMAVTAFAGAVGLAGFKLAQIAGEAEDTQGKFETVFAGMEKEANAFVDNFSNKFDMADSSIQEWLATLKDTFDPLGVAEEKSFKWGKTLTALALDVKTFYPGIKSVNGAINRFTSYLVGNHEAVREMGVVVNQAMIKTKAYEMGIADAGEELSELQKMTARYKLLLEGLENAHGNAMRELDNFNMAMTQVREIGKETAQEYGENLLPAFTDLLQMIKEILKWLRDLPESTQDVIAKFMIWSGIIAGITGPLALIIGFLPQIAAGLAMISTSFTPFLVGGAIIAGLTTIVTLFQKWRHENELLNEDLSNIKKRSALEERLKLLKEQKKEILAARKAKGRAGSSKRIEAPDISLEEVNRKIEATKNKLTGLSKGSGEDKVVTGSKQLEKEMKFAEKLRKDIESDRLLFEKGFIAEDELIRQYELILNNIENNDEISKEKREKLYNQYYNKLEKLRVRHQNKLEKFNEKMAKDRKKLNMSEYEYKLYLLNQEEQNRKEKYGNLVQDYEKYQSKMAEISKYYNQRRKKLAQNAIDNIINSTQYRYETEKEANQAAINKLKKLAVAYKNNKQILEMINEEIKNLRNGGQQINWLEKSFVNLGYNIDQAKNKFQSFKNSLINGITESIVHFKSLSDVLNSIADQIASMVIKQAIVKPMVNSFLSFTGLTAHSGGLITANGLKPVSQALKEYHNGGWIGAEPLKPNEQLVKAENGELMLTEDQQNELFGGQGSGGNIVNLNITAMDSQDVMRVLTKDGGRAVAQAFNMDFSKNGDTRTTIKRNL